ACRAGSGRGAHRRSGRRARRGSARRALRGRRRQAVDRTRRAGVPLGRSLRPGGGDAGSAARPSASQDREPLHVSNPPGEGIGKSMPAYETAAPYVPETPVLETLRAAAASCRGCPLWQTGTQTVFGEGAADARIVFVGEQ